MGNARRALALALGLALVFAACGDDDAIETTRATAATTTTIAATTTTAAPTTTTTKAPTTTTTTTEPPGLMLPPSGVIGVVDMPYKWGDETGMPEEGELPFPLGVIEAHWYIAGDRYAVVFKGLDLEETGPLCPGSSIMTAGGMWEHVSNSPSPGASCEGTGAPVVGPPAGTQVCAGVVSYITEIPTSTMGTLYASIEYYPGTGTFYGASSVAEVDLQLMPEIDPSILGC